MIILSNGFTTNMPNSEEVSQGGPANFARLFSASVVSDARNKWIGVVFQTSNSDNVRLKKIFSFSQKEYLKMYIPRKALKQILQAKKSVNPEKIFDVSITRLTNFIKKNKPDVIFLNGFGIFNWVILKAGQRAGVPVIIQHAGILTKEVRLHKHLYSKAGLKVMERMEKDSTNLTDAEIFLNTWSRDYYKKHVAKRYDDNAVVIPLPFDFSAFNNTPKDQKKSIIKNPKGYLSIGTIARWDKIKNHKAILALARAAKSQGLAWKFYAVAKIPELHPLKKDYKKNVTVFPSLDRIGISDFCRSMDLLILPSIFDVSPTVVLEAIATDTPVAISDHVGYVNKFIECGAKKWIVDFNNPDKALRRIKSLARKPMPQMLRREIAEDHNYVKIFSAYINLFEKVISEKNISVKGLDIKMIVDGFNSREVLQKPA